MLIHSIISSLATRLKGEELVLDSNIPISYLLRFAVSRMVSLIRAIWVTKKFKTAFFHPSATLKCTSKFNFGKNTNLARGTYVDALSVEGLNFGNSVSVGIFTTIECTGSLKHLGKGMQVGDNVGLGTHGYYGCAGGIVIGSDTIIGNYVSMHSENHNYDDPEIPIRLQGVNRQGIKIGRNCWIGAKVTILDGATVGDGCIIAAGSVVKGGVYEKDGIYGGVPAKLLKKRL